MSKYVQRNLATTLAISLIDWVAFVLRCASYMKKESFVLFGYL